MRTPADVSRLHDWQEKYRATCKRVVLDDRELCNCLADLRLPGSSLSGGDDLSGDIRVLSGIYDTLMDEREAEASHLKATVDHVKQIVSDTIVLIDDIDSGKIDPETLESSLSNANSVLSDSKAWIIKRYEELQRDFVTMDRDLNSLARRYEGENWGTSETISEGPKRRRRRIDTTLPPAISEFEDFVARTGGHTGGWDADDHTKYLRAIHSAPDNGKLRDDILSKLSLPIYDFEAIKKHDEWYLQYSSLDKARREALAKWRANKQKITQKPDIPEETVPEKVESEKDDAWRAEQQKKLIEWKARQAAEQEVEKREEKRRKEDEKRREKERFARRRAEAAAKLASWETEKKIEEEMRVETEPQFETLDPLTIARLKRREEQAAERQRERKEKKEREKLEREARQARLAQESRPQYQGGSRLMQTTAAARYRKKDKKRSENVFGIQDVGHRAVPDWRKGL